MIAMAKSLEDLVKAGKIDAIAGKKHWGLSLLELLVGLALIGVVTAVAYPILVVEQRKSS